MELRTRRSAAYGVRVGTLRLPQLPQPMLFDGIPVVSIDMYYFTKADLARLKTAEEAEFQRQARHRPFFGEPHVFVLARQPNGRPHPCMLRISAGFEVTRIGKRCDELAAFVVELLTGKYGFGSLPSLTNLST